MKKVILISILISAFCSITNAQSVFSEKAVLASLNNYKKVKRKFPIAKNNTNEAQLLLSGLFVGYKKYVSSQDGSKCAFHQTCSEYALVAVKKKGVVVGGIQFFDRFTRCNTCSPLQYKVNPKSNKFDDPAD